MDHATGVKNSYILLTFYNESGRYIFVEQKKIDEL